MNLKVLACTFVYASLFTHASRIESERMRLELESLQLEEAKVRQDISELDGLVAQSDVNTSNAIHGKAHLVHEAVSMMMNENCMLKLADAFQGYGSLNIEEAQQKHSRYIHLRKPDLSDRAGVSSDTVWGGRWLFELEKVSTKGRPQLQASIGGFINSTVSGIGKMAGDAGNVFNKLIWRGTPTEAAPANPEAAKRKAQRREKLLFRQLVIGRREEFDNLKLALKAKWQVTHAFIVEKLGWYKISKDSPLYANALKIVGNIIWAILKLVGLFVSFVTNKMFNVFTGADYNLKEFVVWFETSFPIFQGLIPTGVKIGEFFSSLQEVNDVILHHGFNEDAAKQICTEHMSGRLFLGETVEKLPNPQLDKQVNEPSASATLRKCMVEKAVEGVYDCERSEFESGGNKVILKKFKWSQAWKSWNFSGAAKFKRTREKDELAFPWVDQNVQNFSSVKPFRAPNTDAGVIDRAIQSWIQPKQRPSYEEMISFVLKQEETLLFYRLLLPDVLAQLPGVEVNINLMAFQVKAVKDALAKVEFPWWYYEEMCKAEFIEDNSAIDFAPVIFAARTKELLAARWVRSWYRLDKISHANRYTKSGARCKEVPDGFCPEGTSANWKLEFDMEAFSKIMAVMMTVGWVPSKIVALGLASMVGQTVKCMAAPCEMPIQVLPGTIVGLRGLIFPPCRCMVSECVFEAVTGCVIKPNWDTSNPYYWLPAPGQKCTLQASGNKAMCQSDICDADDFSGKINGNEYYFGKLGRDGKDIFNCVSTKGDAQSQVWTVGQIPDGKGGLVVNSPVERNNIYELLGQTAQTGGFNITVMNIWGEVDEKVAELNAAEKLDGGEPTEAGGFVVPDTIKASELPNAMEITPEIMATLETLET